MSQKFLSVSILLSILAPACGGGPTPPISNNVTLTGTLVSGTAPNVAVELTRELIAPSLRSQALSGYTLTCDTYTTPAISAEAVADANGDVSLTIAAMGVPLSCYVTDAAGLQVATVAFQSGSAGSDAVVLSASAAAFGNITVDATSGIASAGLSQDGTLVTQTPAGVSCPVGLWGADLGTTAGPGGACAGNDIEFNILITQNADGSYRGSMTTTNDYTVQGSDLCSDVVDQTISASFSSSTLTFSFPQDLGNGCGGAGYYVGAISFEGDSACDQLTANAALTVSGCADCNGTPGGSNLNTGCEGCGAVTCTAPDSGNPIVLKKL